MTYAKDPLVPDWSCFLTRAGVALKQAEDAGLARDYEAMINALGEMQNQINSCAYWVVKRDVLEAVK